MSKRKTPSRQQLDQAVSDGLAQAKARAAAPTWSDIQHAFPDAKIVDHPDGTRECTIEDHTPQKKRLRALNEMFRPKTRLDCELGQARHGRHKELVMKHKDGSLRYVPEHFQEHAERKGLRRPFRRNGATTSYWRDRDGVMWKRVGWGDWEVDPDA